MCVWLCSTVSRNSGARARCPWVPWHSCVWGWGNLVCVPTCATKPGHPATAHWGYADPSEGDGSDEEKLEAFRKTLHAIQRRLSLLISLPDEKLHHAMLQSTARDLASH